MTTIIRKYYLCSAVSALALGAASAITEIGVPAVSGLGRAADNGLRVTL